MVPIVEPEVLMDGSHDINKCYLVTTDVLNECYNELENHKVDLRPHPLKLFSSIRRFENNQELILERFKLFSSFIAIIFLFNFTDYKINFF